MGVVMGGADIESGNYVAISSISHLHAEHSYRGIISARRQELIQLFTLSQMQVIRWQDAARQDAARADIHARGP